MHSIDKLSRNRPATFGAFLLLVLGSSSCQQGNAASASADRLAIGVGALAGKPGYEGVTRGVELAVERLNETPGSRFAMRLPTRGSNSVVQVAQQLREDHSVIGVVGHPESGSTLDAIPVYEDGEHQGTHAVPVISPTASSPRLTGSSPWFFRVAPSDDEAARYAANWVFDSLHARRAAVIYRNDSYGRDWSATFTNAFTAREAEVIIRDPYLTGVAEWEAYALEIRELKADVVLFPGDAPDAIAMQRALRLAGVRVPFIGGDGTEAMVDDAEAASARFVAFYRVDRANTPEGRHFVKRYRERFGVDPDMFAALSYDAALAIGRAVQAGAKTRAAVRTELERFGNGATPIEGAGGLIAFNDKHDVKGRTVVIAPARQETAR